MEFKTIEEAKAEIIRLQEQLTERTNERDTLSQNNERLSNELQEVRQLNQTYFNKLSAQFTTQPEGDDEDGDDEAPQTCEDYAATINLLGGI